MYIEDKRVIELTTRYEATCFVDIIYNVKRSLYVLSDTIGYLFDALKNLKFKNKSLYMKDDKIVISRFYAEILADKEMRKFFKSMKKAGYEYELIVEEFSDPKKDFEDLRNYFLESIKDNYIISD